MRRVAPPGRQDAPDALAAPPEPRPSGTEVLKLHQDSSGALNTVTAYGADYVEINLERHTGSIIVMPDSPVVPWPVHAFDALTPELFAMQVGS